MRYMFLVCMLQLVSMPADAGIYRCKDAAGKSSFSDHPCSTNSIAPLTSNPDEPSAAGPAPKVKGGSMSVYSGSSVGGRSSNSRSERSGPESEIEAARERALQRSLKSNEARKTKLIEENPILYKELEKKSGGDLSRCLVNGNGEQMISRCVN